MLGRLPHGQDYQGVNNASVRVFCVTYKAGNCAGDDKAVKFIHFFGVNGMSHMARVIGEKHELDVKIGALNAFLSKGKPENINQEAWDLLVTQAEQMLAYSDTLGRRLALALD